MTDNGIPRVGVFLCECGGNISDVIDVQALTKIIEEWENVIVARNQKYLCSTPTQEMIITTIVRRNLDRIVIASCSPRMHLSTFQSMLEHVGMNPYMLEFVNIREHCSWVHGPQASANATKKALTLIKGGYYRSLELEPLDVIREKSSRDILIIGGGIGGITAALELSKLDYNVHLLEKKPSIGGNMAKLTKVFPTLDCAQCILTPKMAEVSRNPNINLLSYAEISGFTGRPGNFNVEIYEKPRGVNVKECRNCGVCEKVCPVLVQDEFNEGLTQRKAAYIEFPQAVPSAYVIDFDECTGCGACMQSCPSNAINLNDKGKSLDLTVGAIILATGYELYDAHKLDNYGYGHYKNVITMMELERLTSASGPTEGYIQINDHDVRQVAILLCAGSRDKNHIIHCSRICCMYALKQAYILKKMLGIDVTIYYTDIRATGKGYEELYWRVQEEGVQFIRGKVAEIWKKNDKLVVIAEDTLTGSLTEDEFDLVALATAMISPPNLKSLASVMRLPLGEDEFLQEKHPKLDPVESLTPGILACGCVISPKDVRDTVSDALGAAAKAATFLTSGYITTSPEKAFVHQELCSGCKLCVELCPSGAISLPEERAIIDPFLCTECGACIPICPEEAIDFKNHTTKQLLATLRGLLSQKDENEVRIVAFVDNKVGYAGIDLLGLARTTYPEEVQIISIPSTALLSTKHIYSAFANGADGILVIEGQEEIDAKHTKKRMIELSRDLKKVGVRPMRLRYSYVPLPVYRKAGDLFTRFTDRIKKIGPIAQQKRDTLKLLCS